MIYNIPEEIEYIWKEYKRFSQLWKSLIPQHYFTAAIKVAIEAEKLYNEFWQELCKIYPDIISPKKINANPQKFKSWDGVILYIKDD